MHLGRLDNDGVVSAESQFIHVPKRMLPRPLEVVVPHFADVNQPRPCRMLTPDLQLSLPLRAVASPPSVVPIPLDLAFWPCFERPTPPPPQLPMAMGGKRPLPARRAWGGDGARALPSRVYKKARTD